MSNLTIFDPFREMVSLRSMLDQAFDNMLSRNSEFGTELLAVDMYQTDDNIVVKTAMPGIKAEDIQVSVSNNLLTIQGQSKDEKVVENARYHLRERRAGSFSRSIELPGMVVAEKADAKFEDGVLTLTLPKAEDAKARAIAVKVK